MFVSSQKNLTLTLFVSVALFLTFATPSGAHIQQRDHGNLKRLIRKRSPLPQDGLSLIFDPAVGAAAGPTSTSTSSVSTPTGVSTSSTSPSTGSITSSATPISSTPITSSLSSSASESNTSSLTSVSSAASLTPSSASSTSSNTSAASTSEAINVTSPPDTSTPTSKSVVTLTQSVDASQTATVIPQVQSNATKPKSMTVTILIIVGASIAGIAILWTVFRKWKLGRSSKFDERLQPIDWRPTTAEDEGIPGLHRRLSGASSFHSGSGHPNSARGYGTSDYGHDSSAYVLPDHDFTAGPASLAPVGGYADPARGSSPQPHMNEMGGGLPLHYQGYASQDGYELSRASRR